MPEELGIIPKLRVLAFATEMAAKHPEQAKNIATLKDTMEDRLTPELRVKMNFEMNRNAEALLAKARATIDANPKILEQVAGNPDVLGKIMGISAPKPPPKVQTQVAAAAPAAKKAAPVPSPPSRQRPSQDDGRKADNDRAAGKAAPAAPVAPAAKAKQTPAKPSDDAEMAQIVTQISKMKGFDEFLATAEKTPALRRVLEETLEGKGSTPEGKLAKLKSVKTMLDGDPDYFVKMNKLLKEQPGLANSMLSLAAENPGIAPMMMGMAPKVEEGLSFFGKIFGIGGAAKIGSLLNNFLNSGFLRTMVGMLSGVMNIFANAGEVFSSSNNGYKLTDTFRQLGFNIFGAAPTATPQERLSQKPAPVSMPAPVAPASPHQQQGTG